MSVCVLGIDPGISGGVGFYWPGAPGRVEAIDIPVADGEVDTDTLAAEIAARSPVAAVIERVGAMPKQGVSSTFRFGQAYGAARATVSVLRIPSHLVTPAKWKAHYRLTADKEDARGLALRLWPGAGCFARKKDHGRAEGVLLARYGVEKLMLLGPVAQPDFME